MPPASVRPATPSGASSALRHRNSADVVPVLVQSIPQHQHHEVSPWRIPISWLRIAPLRCGQVGPPLALPTRGIPPSLEIGELFHLN